MSVQKDDLQLVLNMNGLIKNYFGRHDHKNYIPIYIRLMRKKSHMKILGNACEKFNSNVKSSVKHFMSNLAVLLLPVHHLQYWKESQKINIISFCQRCTHFLIIHRNKLPPLLEIYQRGWYWSILVNANQRVHEINKRHYQNTWDSEINIYTESITTGEANTRSESKIYGNKIERVENDFGIKKGIRKWHYERV